MQAVTTIAGAFKPNDRILGIIYDAFIVFCGSLLVGLSTKLSIYLPFSPVPITGQTFAVLVIGILLGSKRGALTILTYLAEGMLGLPVFTTVPGPAALIGPTGGYLLGFVAAAYLTGLLAERGWDRHFTTTMAAMLIGDAVLLTTGFIWLTVLTNIKTAFITGFLVFVPGDLLKAGLAAGVLPMGWKLIDRSRDQ